MHQHERHQLIVERARTAPRVEVTALAEELDVTPETVRRDLTILERHGLLRRVHGGAIAVEKLGFEPTTAIRSQRYTAEKDRIGRAAAALIPQDASVLLDSGTTVACVAAHLPVGGELTVVTNSLTIAAQLQDRLDIQLYLLGGRVRGRTQAAVGTWTLDALREVNVDLAFMGTNGVTAATGLTTPDQAEAAVKRAMVAVGRRVVAVTDHTKVGVSNFARFAPLDEVDTIVTDTGLDPETADELSAHGPEVIRA